METGRREEYRTGVDYLEAATTLLQRVRNAHPTAGLFDAAELQWWWRTARPTDDLGQLFWFDDTGRPEAAVIVTAWSNRIALDPILLPDAPPELVAHVIERGLDRAADVGHDVVGLEFDRSDDVTRNVLLNHGFTFDEDGGLTETWLAADARPEVSPLHDGYRLTNRAETADQPHHMIERNSPDVEARLQQTSLYRPDLDLLVLTDDAEVAGYGLFWFDPHTSTGLVEPMRTEDSHQRRGLARHILTTGVDKLARLGAERIKICFEPDNAASRHLYLDVGFEPVRQCAFAHREDTARS